MRAPSARTALILAGLADIAAGAIDTADERMAEAEALSEARSGSRASRSRSVNAR